MTAERYGDGRSRGLCGFCHRVYTVRRGIARECCEPGRKFDQAHLMTQDVPTLEPLDEDHSQCLVPDASDGKKSSPPPGPPLENDSGRAVSQDNARDNPNTYSTTKRIEPTETSKDLSKLIAQAIESNLNATRALSSLGGLIGGQVEALNALAAAISNLAESISGAVDSGLIGDGDEPKLPTHDMEGNPIAYK